MKTYFFLLIFIFAKVISSCVQDTGTEGIKSRSEKKIIQKAIALAESYAEGQLKKASKTVTGDGVIILDDTQKKYVIFPAKVYVGLINDDQDRDAIVSVDSYQGQYQVPSEQLIIIKSGGKFLLNKAIESDMKILQIRDGIITAEVPTHTRNSPLFNCSECQEIVNYQFKNGELIRLE